jgi:SAM-dependent methyltransferase
MVMPGRRGIQAGANAEQAAQWDGPAGEHRIRHAAAGAGPRDRVLDIGCGTGQSTRDAARAAVAGSALGVDLSERMLEHARRLSAGEGLRNVTFLQADAQVHRFAAAHFDLCISRFGAMFFAGPALLRLRAALAAHDTGNGVFFGARSWIITARRG